MYNVFDAHCDTLSELLKNNTSLNENYHSVDLKRMSEYNTYIQVFAAFVDKKNVKISPLRHCLELIGKYRCEIEKNVGRVMPITSLAELERAKKDGGVYSILSIEGGEAFDNSLALIKIFYDLGVRLVTLTWNYANELADGITESRGGGLTDFGKSAVSLMERLGIMIDVSHISERGFWDVVENTKYPFIVSHSCVKNLCPHVRNLSDEQIDAVITRRGVIGVNFFPEFLSENKDCPAEKIIEHIEYIVSRGGINSAAFGSDFDGVSSLPRGTDGVSSMKYLMELMIEREFSRDDVDKISFGNLYNLFHSMFERQSEFCSQKFNL